MAFTSKLFIQGEERNVLNSEFLYQQLMDGTGRPKTQVHGGIIQLEIESSKNDELFYHWMFTDQQMNQGYVRFYKRDGFSKLFDFEFANCHCVSLEEGFTSYGDHPMTMTLHLSPGIQKVRDQIFEKSWNPNNPYREKAPITEREEEGLLQECYFEDKNGNTIERPKHNQEIYLVIKSSGMSGKSVDVDLSDSKINFEYQGNILEDDQLKNLRINSDLTRIALKTLRQKK